MPDLAGYVVGPGGEVTGGGPDVKATAASTGGALTVMESVISQGPPRHVHAREDECFYVLEGTVTGTCGDEAFDAPPGSFVFLLRGLAHTFRAPGGEARLLLIAVPGGIEHYFEEINNAASAAEQERTGDKYGIRVVLSVPRSRRADRPVLYTPTDEIIRFGIRLRSRVAGDYGAGGGHLAAGELHGLGGAPVRECAFAAAEDDRVDHQLVLIDQVMAGQHPQKLGAADQVQVGSGLPFKRGDARGDVAFDQD
jgi:mannose-6-phosphate isomerase-like protein (cupin superfamily)